VEINEELLSNVPMTIIARKYNVSYQSLKRHRKNCLHQQIKEMADRVLVKTEEKVKSTLYYYDRILEHFQKHPEILQGITMTNILQTLRDRAALLGEDKKPPRVEIRWGAGLMDNSDSESIKLEIPIEKEKDKND